MQENGELENVTSEACKKAEELRLAIIGFNEKRLICLFRAAVLSRMRMVADGSAVNGKVRILSQFRCTDSKTSRFEIDTTHSVKCPPLKPLACPDQVCCWFSTADWVMLALVYTVLVKFDLDRHH